MKTKFTLLAVFMAVFFSTQAQTPVTNGSFEFWDASNITPDGWTSYEKMIAPIAGVGLSMRDTTDKVQGTSSTKLTTRFVSLAQDSVAGAVAIGDGMFDGQSPKIFGAVFTSSPDTLEFYYKFVPVGNDTAGLQMSLSKAGSAGNKMAFAAQLLPTGGQWGIINVALKQFYTDTLSATDTINLAFFSSLLSSGSSNGGRVGSELHIDAVRFGYVSTPTFIENINSNLSARVFPIPSNNLVTIQTSEVVKNASIVVYDMTGKVITHEFGGGNNFELSTNNWESGLYTYSILSAGVVVNKGRIAVQH